MSSVRFRITSRRERRVVYERLDDDFDSSGVPRGHHAEPGVPRTHMHTNASACLSADWPVYSIVKDRLTRRSRLEHISLPTARRDPPEAGKHAASSPKRGSRASCASFESRPVTAGAPQDAECYLLPAASQGKKRANPRRRGNSAREEPPAFEPTPADPWSAGKNWTSRIRGGGRSGPRAGRQLRYLASAWTTSLGRSRSPAVRAK